MWSNNQRICRICNSNVRSQIIIFVATAKGATPVSVVISYSLVYDAIDVMCVNNLATKLSAQIQVGIKLIDMVRKPSVVPIVLAKQGALPLRKLRKLNKPQPREELGLFSILHYSNGSE